MNNIEFDKFCIDRFNPHRNRYIIITIFSNEGSGTDTFATTDDINDDEIDTMSDYIKSVVTTDKDAVLYLLETVATANSDLNVCTDSYFIGNYSVETILNNNESLIEVFNKIPKTEAERILNEISWYGSDLSEIARYRLKVPQTTEELLTRLHFDKVFETTDSGRHDDWYDPYYAIGKTFTEEEIRAMTDEETKNLIRLASNMSDSLY